MGSVNRFFSWESTEKLREQTKVYEVMKQRQEQWNDLCKAAKGSGDHADKAKLALFYILTHSGNPMGSESGFKIYIEGDKLKQNFYNHDWAELAARALKDAADVGCGSRDITAYCIRMGLKEGSVRARTSDTLLEGLRRFEKPSNDGYAITREQLAKITAEALDTEILRKHEDQDEFYQQMLLTDLQKYRHRMIFPKLDAMSEKSKFPGVRTLAKNILDEFRHSVTVMWDETAIDQTATAAARADRLKIALDEANNADVTVSELFKAYKGYKLESSTDPGLPFLQQAMNDKNERTRMAAARVVMESLLAVQHGLKAKALETLGNLAVHGTVDRYRADALKELSRFNVPIPVVIKSNAGGNLRIQRGTQGLEVIKQP